MGLGVLVPLWRLAGGHHNFFALQLMKGQLFQQSKQTRRAKEKESENGGKAVLYSQSQCDIASLAGCCSLEASDVQLTYKMRRSHKEAKNCQN